MELVIKHFPACVCVICLIWLGVLQHHTKMMQKELDLRGEWMRETNEINALIIKGELESIRSAVRDRIYRQEVRNIYELVRREDWPEFETAVRGE